MTHRAVMRMIARMLGLALALVTGTTLRAQDLVLKRAIVGAADVCAPQPTAAAPTVTPSVAPASASRGSDDGEARRLSAAGYEAEILGDFRTARDAFVRAAALLPRDDRLAYHLARAHEALDEDEAAARAYCRTLSIAPTGADAVDSRQRLRALVARGALASTIPSASVRATFAEAVRVTNEHALARADDIFSRVIRDAPSLAEAWYDRAVVRLALGRRADAAHDLERYVALRPSAPDAPSVHRQIDRLRRPVWSASAALVQGLIVPGLGQVYTHRPLNGLAVLIVAGGAATWALSSRDEIRERTFTDVLGFPYTGRETVRVRPHLTEGLAIAGVAAIGAAIEAWHYAKQSSSSPRAIALTLRPDPLSRTLALRISIAH